MLLDPRQTRMVFLVILEAATSPKLLLQRSIILLQHLNVAGTTKHFVQSSRLCWELMPVDLHR